MAGLLHAVFLAVTLHWAVFALTARLLPWVLPCALALGALAVRFCRGRKGAPADGGQRPFVPAPRAAWIAAVAVVLLATLLAAYGALATGSRQWDGVVAWDLRARELAEEPGLAQPFFTDPGVYSHSRDYPLLQPSLLAALDRLLGAPAGRALFPGLLLLLVWVVGHALCRRGLPWPAWLGAGVGIVLTPSLITPHGGAVDSGYAELLLAVCVAAIGSGLLRGDALLLLAGTWLAIGTKPEGLVYAALPVLIGWGAGDRAVLRPALLGWTAGALCWLPLQLALQHHAPTAPFAHLPAVVPPVAGLAALLLVGDAVLRRLGAAARWRWIAVLVLGPAVLVLLPVVLHLAGRASGTLEYWFAGLGGSLARLAVWPAVVGGFLWHGLVRLHFGATFVLPWFALFARRLPGWTQRDGHVVVFLLLGLLTATAPFVLAGAIDLDDHIRSRAPRLLLHWLGPAWLLGGTALGLCVGPQPAAQARDGGLPAAPAAAARRAAP